MNFQWRKSWAPAFLVFVALIELSCPRRAELLFHSKKYFTNGTLITAARSTKELSVRARVKNHQSTWASADKLHEFWEAAVANLYDWESYASCDTRRPCAGCLTVVYSNHTLSIEEGKGFIHGARKKQYTTMFNTLISTHHMVDFRVVVNLKDKPELCALNFCRRVGKKNFILIPNHRFFGDDTLIDLFPENNDWPRAPEIVQKFQTMRTHIGFEGRSKKMFFSGRPHPAKVALMELALKHLNVFKVRLLIDTPHCWMRMTNSSSCETKIYLNEQCPVCQTCAKCMNCLTSGVCSHTAMPQEEMFFHRYLIYADGNTRSDKLRNYLLTGSCILNVESEFEEYYTGMLNPYQNFIPIYSNMSNLLTGYDFGLRHKDLCLQMAENNVNFAETFLSEKSILVYMASLLNHINMLQSGATNH